MNSKTEIAGKIVFAMINNYISLFREKPCEDAGDLISELYSYTQKVSNASSLSKII